MPKVSPLQSNFNSGEFSPLLYGRVDTERYSTALATCLNYLPTIQGGLTRRPGCRFVAEVKDSSKSTRLVSFEFSTTQAYVIEFGDLYLRFYRNNGQILDGGAYEVVSPYAAADLFQLKFTQSADVLYVTHPSYAPRKITRTGHINWTVTEIDFLDGPYLPINKETTTLVASSGTGSVTVTASATVGINGGDGFKSTDVGRTIRMKNGSNWPWLEITAFTDTTHVTALVKDGSAPTSGNVDWRLGVWSGTTGYPGAVTFHEDRLFLGGATDFPQRFDGSNSGDYENFAPTDLDGTIEDSHAVSFTLSANEVNTVRWMVSDEKGLLAGSVGREWTIKPSSQGEALSPSNITAKPATAYGSANIQPVQVGKAVLFLQRAGKKLREMTYFYEVDGFQSPDLTALSEHITGTGIVEIAYQKEPQSIIWCVRNDGALAAMTYERDVDSLKVGWHRHTMGGHGDAAQSDAIVESVAVIPASDGSRDEVWMIVKRYIDGGVKRYVEYMTRIFEDSVDQKDAFFVDSGLTYDVPKTITAATKANPVVITSAAHGFSNGDEVLVSEVKGMDDLNTNTYTVANKATDTFELSGIDGTGFSTYVSSGEVRKYITTVSGLTHLEGQTVSILGDGAAQPDKVVSSGAITLSAQATTVHVGLGYNSDGKTLRIEAGSQDGTALGKKRRIHRVGILMHRSLGLKLGMSFDDLDELTFRSTSDPLTRAVPLFSGVRTHTIPADYDYENQICWRQDQPLPSMILAIMPQVHVQDRG